MNLFYCLKGGKIKKPKKINEPEDVKCCLQSKEHWQEKKSAYEFAHSWVCAKGLPPRVRSVLDTCSDYKGAELVEGQFEYTAHLVWCLGNTCR